MSDNLESGWGFNFRVGCDDIFRAAMETYITDPSKAECIARAITECVGRIHDCDEEALTRPVGVLNCADGWVEVNGKCVRIREGDSGG